FSSHASNLVPGDDQMCFNPMTHITENCSDVFVHDRDPDGNGIFDEIGSVSTARMSVSTTGEQAQGKSGDGYLSRDHRYVLFSSDANNLVPGDDNICDYPPFGSFNCSDAFVRDRDTDGNGIFDEPGGVATTMVSVELDGTLAPTGGSARGFSPDGRFVLLWTNSSLVPGDHNGFYDLYLRDRDPDGNGIFDEPGHVSIERVSLAWDGSEPDADIEPSAVLSNDLRSVAFWSDATNLVPNDGTRNGEHDTS